MRRVAFSRGIAPGIGVMLGLVASPATFGGAGDNGNGGPHIGGGHPGEPTPIDEVVLYAVDDVTKELLRYPFSGEDVQPINVLGYEDGNPVTSVECLAYIPHGPHKGLYGVDNYNGLAHSRLVRINAFNANVEAVGADVGFGNIEGVVSLRDPVTDEWTLMAVQTGANNGGANGNPGEIALDWWINGTHAGSLNPAGTYIENFDWWNYDGADIDPMGVNLDYNLNAGPDLGLVSGNITLENVGNQPAEIVVQMVMPLPQSYWGGSEFMGSAAVGLTTDGGGGTLAPIDGGSCWQALIDGATVSAGSLFAGSWQLHNDGIGSQADSDHFGVPTMISGPPAVQSIGIRMAFTLTPADQASITSAFNLTGQAGTPSAQNLISIDTETGAGAMIMPLGQTFEGLARSYDGELFAARANELWHIDPATSSVTSIGAANFGELRALEYALGDSAPTIEIPGVAPGWTLDGVLFGFSAASDQIVVFNPNSGHAVGYPTPMQSYDLTGMVFVTETSDPYAAVIASIGD